MACSTKRKEFTFLISTRVPRASAPRGRMDTLMSARSEPCSMLPSHTSSATKMARRALRYRAASPALRRSGADTISASGTPARL